tara:strand:+ start:1374 stop:2243 length:870 start_codon:yes stop_codon:yes gene_type:complete
MEENIKKVEAVLFSIGKKIKLDELSRLTQMPNIDDLKSVLYQLQEKYEKNDSSLMLMDEGESWKLTVREKFMPLVQNIVADTEISKTIMETLAVIAWKYPILQSDVIKIRTNKAYDHLKELEEIGFISRTKFGRTNKIKLTDRFFTYFDLPNDKQKAQNKFEKLIPDRIKRKLEKLKRDIDKQEKELVDKKENMEKLKEFRKQEKEQQDKLDKGDIGLDEDKENKEDNTKTNEQEEEKEQIEIGDINLDDGADLELMEDKQQEVIDEEEGDEELNQQKKEENKNENTTP